MAMLRVLLAIHLFLFCCYDFKRPSYGSFLGLKNIHRGATHTSRSLVGDSNGGNGGGGSGSESSGSGSESSGSDDKTVSGTQQSENVGEGGSTANQRTDSNSEEKKNSENEEEKPKPNENGEQNDSNTDAATSTEGESQISTPETGNPGNNASEKQDEGQGTGEIKTENLPESGGSQDDKNLESKSNEVEISKHDPPGAVKTEDGKGSQEGETTQNEATSTESKNTDGSAIENTGENGADGNKLHLDNLDDDIPHYSALRNNRVEKGITDTMVLSDIMGNKGQKSCSVNNGGCSEDQICIRIGNVGVKCVCKEGFLFAGRCILTTSSSAFSSFISLSLSILLTMLLLG
ncbi:merozoite surface protein 5 [Plasmodium gonderi]|uniref:Merozoite surface protein 5 n=1 Tax=Plasmodium gonderi TaxID=77519 RepID=A0A1Y1JDZ0_PLAGO|nr:merozoite surface protein 5 [Plasmodium gonderi]GAW79545.1 merozoite surface protein 5 [Plasmodium gonderi]